MAPAQLSPRVLNAENDRDTGHGPSAAFAKIHVTYGVEK